MPLGLSAAALAVCLTSGIYLLQIQRRHRGYVALGILLLMVGVAFALYIVAAILFIGAVD